MLKFDFESTVVGQKSGGLSEHSRRLAFSDGRQESTVVDLGLRGSNAPSAREPTDHRVKSTIGTSFWGR